MDFSEELRAHGASITYEAADVIDMLHRALDQRDAEITQLRVELQAERELADRLAEAVRAADYVIKSARPDSGWLFAYKEAIEEHATRRAK